MVSIEARPASFELDPSRTALVVVDMQNDFGAEGGMFHRAGIPIAGIRAAVAPTARALAAARRAAIRIVYLKMQFQARPLGRGRRRRAEPPRPPPPRRG